MNQLSGPKVSISRRRLLVASGGLAGAAGAAYAGVRSLGKEGTINARFVIGEDVNNGTLVGTTRILSVIGHIDSPPTRHFHPEYRQEFPEQPPMTVSPSLHRILKQEFDEVAYAVSHDCPDANCSSPRVNRRDFNNARMGKKVTLVYHSGSHATIVS